MVKNTHWEVMASENLSYQTNTVQIIEINRSERWQVYYRLQELGISCHYSSDRPLTVQLGNVKDAIQIWSVVRQLKAPRQQLQEWLKQCWQIQI
jgi:hypothetical protein